MAVEGAKILHDTNCPLATMRGYFQAPDGSWRHLTIPGKIVEGQFVQTGAAKIILVPNPPKIIKASSLPGPKK